MKVALWGSYDQGNFGDDVMAVIFAGAIKDAGHQVSVFKLDASIADRAGLDVAHSYSELLSGADFLVIGGGGMLVGETLTRRWLSRTARQFEAEIRALTEALHLHEVPYIASSIGGDGRGKLTPLPSWRKKLFSGPTMVGATVRLQADVALLAHLGIENVHYYPDVLLNVADLISWERPHKLSKKIRIGLNLARKSGSALARDLTLIARSRGDVELYFIPTHLGAGADYELTGPLDEEFCVNVQYTDPAQLLSVLSNCDIVISSKLHLGVAALSVGTPFYSFAGKAKVREFLAEVDLRKFYFTKSEKNDLLVTIESQLNEGIDPPDLSTFQTKRALSSRHLDFAKSLGGMGTNK